MTEWAERLAAKSPLIMKLGKDAMFRQQDMAFLDALDYLRAQLTLAFSTEDIHEGVKAFFEKREPRVDRQVSCIRGRTSDRTRGAGAGAQALAERLGGDDRRRAGRARRARLERGPAGRAAGARGGRRRGARARSTPARCPC